MRRHAAGEVITRREAVQFGITGLAGMIAWPSPFIAKQTRVPGGSPKLTARPRSPSKEAPGGVSVLDTPPDREAFLYLPARYRPSHPAPFVLMFHGSGGFAAGPINLFQPYVDAAGLILLSVGSKGNTWDAIRGDFGVDIAFIDVALKTAFDACAVDASRVSVEGFSDGASYALAVGRANGNLFSRIAAFSAGLMIPVTAEAKPEIFISHGRQDPILSVENARRIVATLQSGYDVTYREFDGGHMVPPDICSEAASWLADSERKSPAANDARTRAP